MKDNITRLLEEYLNAWHALEAVYLESLVKVLPSQINWNMPQIGVVKALFPLVSVDRVQHKDSIGIYSSLKQFAKGRLGLQEIANASPQSWRAGRLERCIEDTIRQTQEKRNIDLNVLKLDGKLITVDITKVEFITPDEIVAQTLNAINGAMNF